MGLTMPFLASQSFTTPVTGQTSAPVVGLGEVGSLNLICSFTAAGGGTNVFCVVQTTLDDGVVWFDIARFDFTTSSAVKRACCDGRAGAGVASLVSLASADTKIDGLIGNRLRTLVTSSGTYSPGTKVEVYYQTQSN